MNSISRIFTFVKRFLYYGYHGAKHTVDFNAHGIHDLIYAHIKRVKEFMYDPNLTHLEWNSNPNNKNMRLLRELEELSRRVSEDYSVGFYVNRVFDKHRSSEKRISILDRFNNPEFRKELNIARKKDTMIKKGLDDRYWYLLREKVPYFWD